MVLAQFFGGFVAFLFGSIIGSFLNVVALRYGTGLSVDGRSRCFSCGRELGPLDLVPIISFLALRGKCRRCKSKISWQYPLVETTTGLIFLGLFWQLQDAFFAQGLMATVTTPFLFFAAIWSILVVIVVYDLRHTIIPDALVYSFIGLSLARLVFVWVMYSRPSILDLLAGPILFLFFFFFWAVSDGRWMGFGDAKLALGMGIFLGFVDGISAVAFAFWTGSIIAVGLLIVSALLKRAGKTRLVIAGKSLTIKSEVPFAPFLILGMALVFFFHLSLVNVFPF